MQEHSHKLGGSNLDAADPTADVAVGRRLSTHAFTRQGVLLLARGEMVKDDVQLRRLQRDDVVFSDHAPLPLPAPITKTPIPNTPRKEERPPVREDLPMPKLPPRTDPSSYLQEIPVARLLRTTAMRQVGQVIEEVRSGRSVDLSPVRDTVSEILASAQRNAQALCSLLRLKSMDDYTFAHSVNVCVLSVVIAREQGVTIRLEEIGLGALLHDIGKSLLAPEVLQKAGPLTAAEWEEVRRHPRLGFDLLSRGATSTRWPRRRCCSITSAWMAAVTPMARRAPPSARPAAWLRWPTSMTP